MAETATEEKKDGIPGLTLTPGFGEGTDKWDGFSGAGMVDTVAGLVKSIQEGNKAAIAAYGVGLAFDVVGAVLNPLGALLGAGVGWLIDHLYFLREPLDLLMGDNIAVRGETEKISGDAEKYAGIATAHLDALKKLETWTGATADAFKKSMAQVGDELEAIGMAMKGSAEIMATMGACVTAFRSLVRDIIAMVIGNLIGGAIVAAGLAPFTFGASIVAFVGVAVATALEALGRIIRHITNLKSLLTANKTASDQLGTALTKISDDAARLNRGGGSTTPSGAPPVKPPDSKPPDVPGATPPPKPGDTVPAGAPPVSKPPEVPGSTAPPKPADTVPAGAPPVSKPPEVPGSTAPPKPADTVPAGAPPVSKPPEVPGSTAPPKPADTVPAGAPPVSKPPEVPGSTAPPKPADTVPAGAPPASKPPEIPGSTAPPKPADTVPAGAPPASKPPEIPGSTTPPKPADTTTPSSAPPVSKPPEVPGSGGSGAPKPPDPAAPKPPDPTPTPAPGATTPKPKLTMQDVKDFGNKILQGRKDGMEKFGEFGKGKLEAKLMGPPHNKTPEEAADISRWIKNFEELAAPGGSVKVGGHVFVVGSLLHLAHELWKEMASDVAAKAENSEYMQDLKDHNKAN